MANEKRFTRRDVLKGGTVAGVGLAAGSLLGPRGMYEAAEAAEAEPLELIVSGALWNIGWWIDPRMGWTAGGEAFNCNVTEVGPAEFDAAVQATMLEEAIAKKPDGIIAVPFDPDQMNDPCRKAMEAGIPVICSNTDIAEKKWRYGHIGMENFPGGYTQGMYIVNNLLGDTEGKAMILTGIGLENLGNRTRGLEAAFEESGVEVVDIVNDHLDPNLGTQACSASLLAHPEINIIAGTDSGAGESACRAVIEQGHEKGDIIIMGMDRDDTMLKYIKDGWMQATAVQRNFTEFYLDVFYLQNFVRQIWRKGAFPSAPGDAMGLLPVQVPPVTDTGVMFATPENVDFFYHEPPA